MKRSEMVKFIEDRLKYIQYSRTVQKPPSFQEIAIELLFYIEQKGMKPPCVDGDKCQALLRKYVDPNFNYWDEDYEKMMGKE